MRSLTIICQHQRPALAERDNNKRPRYTSPTSYAHFLGVARQHAPSASSFDVVRDVLRKHDSRYRRLCTGPATKVAKKIAQQLKRSATNPASAVGDEDGSHDEEDRDDDEGEQDRDDEEEEQEEEQSAPASPRPSKPSHLPKQRDDTVLGPPSTSRARHMTVSQVTRPCHPVQ